MAYTPSPMTLIKLIVILMSTLQAQGWERANNGYTIMDSRVPSSRVPSTNIGVPKMEMKIGCLDGSRVHCDILINA
jgi:hypothetical protein